MTASKLPQLSLFVSDSAHSEATVAKPAPDPDEIAWDRKAAWKCVMADLSHLERTMRAIAARDPRMSADDLLNDLVVDLVESFHLYDPARGRWRIWAHTRARLTRLRHQRKLRYHRSDATCQIGESADPEDGYVNPALPVGARGSVARTEALIDLLSAYDYAQDDERDTWKRELYGTRKHREPVCPTT